MRAGTKEEKRASLGISAVAQTQNPIWILIGADRPRLADAAGPSIFTASQYTTPCRPPTRTTHASTRSSTRPSHQRQTSSSFASRSASAICAPSPSPLPPPPPYPPASQSFPRVLPSLTLNPHWDRHLINYYQCQNVDGKLPWKCHPEK